MAGPNERTPSTFPFCSYLFFPYAREDGRIAPVLSLGWTLNYERFFYVILALCLGLARPWLSLGLGMVGLVVGGLVIRSDAVVWVFWTNPLILEFLFGVVLARLWHRGVRYPHLTLALLFGASGFVLLGVLHTTDLPRVLAAGVPATLIVAAGTVLCPHRRTPLQNIGDASYALYLSHRFTLRAASLLVLPLVPATLLGALVFVAGTCCAAIGVSVLVYRHIERPMMRALAHPLRNQATV